MRLICKNNFEFISLNEDNPFRQAERIIRASIKRKFLVFYKSLLMGMYLCKANNVQ